MTAVADVLEAAHITPYLGPHTNHVANGLLLRADLHTLFDCGLVGVDPDSRTVVLHKRLRGSDYGELHGRPVRWPEADGDAPSGEALRRHAERFGLIAA